MIFQLHKETMGNENIPIGSQLKQTDIHASKKYCLVQHNPTNQYFPRASNNKTGTQKNKLKVSFNII